MDSIYGPLEICDYYNEKGPLKVSCILHKDEYTGLRYTSAEINGDYDVYIKLLRYHGYLLKLRLVTSHDKKYSSPEEYGLGMLKNLGWQNLSRDSEAEIQNIGKIEIYKWTIDEKIEREERNSICRHVFNVHILQWPENGYFTTSHDGSIAKKIFDDKQNILIENDAVKITIENNYYYKSNKKGLTRIRYPALHAEWHEDANYQRYFDIATILLSYTYLHALRPLSKISSVGNTYRSIFWPGKSSELIDLNINLQPILISDQRKFLNQAICNIDVGDYNLSLLKQCVERYIFARNSNIIEVSFTAGCEAIEGILILLDINKKFIHESNGDLLSIFKSILRNRVSEKKQRNNISGRLKNIFKVSPWQQLKAYLEENRVKHDPKLGAILSKAKFYNFRNKITHGSLPKITSQLHLQKEIMFYIFDSLLLDLCKINDIRPNGYHTLRSVINGQPEHDEKFIQIYE